MITKIKLMKFTVFISLLLFTVFTYAQGKKEIVQKGIEVKRFFEQNIQDGEKEMYLEKEEFYNFRGDLVQIKEYSDRGKRIDEWYKYTYDNDGNLIVELELDYKGRQKEKIVYEYQNGLKIEKLTYDEKDRLVKKKKYEYQFRK